MAPPLLTVPEVLARLKVGRTTLYELFRKGRLAKRMVEGSVRVSEDDLARYVESTLVRVAAPRRKTASRRTGDIVEFFR